MNASEFRNMDAAAIDAELDKNRRELMDLRCQVALGEDVHPHHLRALKRDIARMETVKGEQARAESAEGGK